MSGQVDVRIAGDLTDLNQGLEQGYTNIRRLRDEGTMTGKELANAMRHAEQAYQKQSREVARLSAEKQKLGIHLRNGRKAWGKENQLVKNSQQNYNNLSTSLIQAQQNLKNTAISKRELTQASKRLQTSTTGLGGAFQRLGGIARQVAGVFGVGLGLYGVLRLFRSATNTIIEFDKGLHALRAITNATSQEMERMSRIALEVGGSSKYGAAGVAELMRQLAKMGFSINEIDHMTESIVKLATAAGEDLDAAAETTATTIRGFQLDAKDTQMVVDNMALSFTQSALDLSAYRESMKYIAPVAKAANFELTDTTAILSLLADAGIKGSLAGTSMRRILLMLSDSSSALTQRLGFAVNSMDDFAHALQTLSEDGAMLEDTMNMVDIRSATVFQRLMENSDQMVQVRDRYRDASGAVDEMANVQMQALSYQVKMAGQAWNSMILSMEKGDGFMSRMARTTLSGFTNIMQRITEAHTKQSRATENSLAILESLHSQINNVNISKERRLQAIRNLRAEFPGYFEDLKEEAILAGGATKEYEDLKDAMERHYQFEVAEEEEQKQRERLEATNKELDMYRRMLIKVENETFRASDALELFYSTITDSKSGMDRAGTGLLKLGTVFRAFAAGTIDGSTEVQDALEQGITLLVAHQERMLSGYGDTVEEATQMTEEAAKDVSIADLIEIHQHKPFMEAIGKLTDEYEKAIDSMVEKKMEADKDLAEPIAHEQAARKKIDQLGKIMEAEKFAAERAGERLMFARATLEVAEREGRNTEASAKRVEDLEGIEREHLKTLKFKEQVRINILEAMEAGSDALERELRVTKDNLRLTQQLEEIQKRIAYDGITLTEELAKLKHKHAFEEAKRLEIEGKSTEAIALRKIANAQLELDMQSVNAQEIQERFRLEEEGHKRTMELMEQRIELQARGISGQEIGDAYERQLSQELSALEHRYSEERKMARNELDNKITGLIEERRQMLIQHKEGSKERARLEKEFDDKIKQEIKTYENDKTIIAQDHARERADIEIAIERAKYAELERMHGQTMDKMELAHEEALYDTAKIDNLWKALDVFGTHQKAIREAERQYEAERLEAEEKQAQARMKSLDDQLQKLKELEVALRDAGDEAKALEVGVEIQEIEQELSGLNLVLERLGFEMRQLEEAPSTDGWEDFISSMRGLTSQLTSMYQSAIDEQHRLAREERQIADRRISELQRDIDIQLRLREQGFASDVALYMEKLEQEKQARDRALKEEERQAERKRYIELGIQALNLATAVTEVIKSETSKAGLIGIATAAVGLLGLWGLWESSKSTAQQSTRYKKGGYFELEGASHPQGGIPIAPGREAEGGEGVGVLSKSATKKYGNVFKDVVDMFNSGTYPESPVKSMDELKQQGFYKNPEINNEFDTSDIKAIRRLMERGESVSYSNGYKVIKKGNRTTRIKCYSN